MSNLKSYIIIDNVAGAYRYWSAPSLALVVEEVNRAHKHANPEDGEPNLQVDDLVGMPPRYQIVPVETVYNLYFQ